MPSPERRLLVVDDDERIARFVAEIARPQGWTVDLALSAGAFQAAFQAHLPDAILLDLQLGAADGVEQLRFLHARGFSGTVVLMSGFDPRVLGAAQHVGSALGIAIAATLEKPMRAARVRAVLRDITTDADAAAIEPPAPRAAVEAAQGDLDITPAMIALAIGAGEMKLFLQAIISAKGRRVQSAEALARWQLPGVGLVAPDAFLPVVEQDQAVVDQLTMWAIETGAATYRQLAALGLAIPIGINISGANLHRLDFPDRVATLLQRTGVPHDAIRLEITESAAMRDLGASADILTRLRLKGFALAIDDFGTGHASLEKLRQLPFSSLKIDRSFVVDLPHSSDALAIVGSVIELARNLGLATVAEGVESEAVADLLTDLNVGALQGYFFSPALAFDAFVTWLRGHLKGET